MRWRPAARRVHRWAGLGVGLLFASIALSGSLLSMQDELLLLRHPEWQGYALPPTRELAGAWARMTAAWQARGLRHADLPSPALPVWQARFDDGSVRYFHPATGRWLLTRHRSEDGLLLAREWHVRLLAGSTGQQALGAIAGLAILLSVAGACLWWPSRRSLRASLRWHWRPTVLRWLSLHRSVAAWLLPLMLVMTLSGLALVYRGPLRKALLACCGGPAASTLPAASASWPVAIDWPRAFATAEAAVAPARLTRVTPSRPGDPFLQFRYRGAGEWNVRGRSRLWLDPIDAKVVARDDAPSHGWGSRIEQAIHPLHAGQVGGRIGQWGVALLGLLPGFLLVTGLLYWRARTRR